MLGLGLDLESVAARGLGGGSATNLLTFTSQFDNAAWTKSEITVTADADSPADKLIASINAARHYAYQGHGQSGSKAFTVRADFKPSGLNFASLGVTNTGGAWSLVQFNVATGVIVSTGTAGGIAVGTGNIIAQSNGYFRCVATWAAVDLSSAVGATFLASGGGDPVFEGLVGDAVNGVLTKNALAAVGVFSGGG